MKCNARRRIKFPPSRRGGAFRLPGILQSVNSRHITHRQSFSLHNLRFVDGMSFDARAHLAGKLLSTVQSRKSLTMIQQRDSRAETGISKYSGHWLLSWRISAHWPLFLGYSKNNSVYRGEIFSLMQSKVELAELFAGNSGPCMRKIEHNSLECLGLFRKSE